MNAAMRRRRLAAEDGFTLVELLVAAVVLMTGVLGVLTLLDGANAATSSTKAREGATSLARELIEASRGLSYADLSTAALAGKLQAQPQHADSSAAIGWQLDRRGRTYTVTAQGCVVDDGTAPDGFGAHTGLPMCAGSTQTGTGDANPDDYRRVTIDVSWETGGRSGRVRQEAVVNNPGSAFATSVRSLRPTTPALTEPYYASSTYASTPSIRFTATTGGAPAYVKWSVDNLVSGNATGSATNWSFDWQIDGVTDGTYVIGAQAFNSDNESGASQAVTVVLNRFAPAVPTGFVGGRNGAFGVELEWASNAERDVSGYRVYRYEGGSAADTKVCETATTDALPTSCRDLTAPATGSPRYYVVALAPARAGTGVEESAHPTVAQMLSVSNSNLPPQAPQNVTATRVDDVVTLGWDDPPAPAAGESGDTLRYYRIYRDGVAYADRYDHTGQATTRTWTDRSPGAGTHTYYLTAVDSALAESPPTPTAGVVG
jgi:type II secretory pathway pseudopilin PulG